MKGEGENKKGLVRQVWMQLHSANVGTVVEK